MSVGVFYHGAPALHMRKVWWCLETVDCPCRVLTEMCSFQFLAHPTLSACAPCVSGCYTVTLVLHTGPRICTAKPLQYLYKSSPAWIMDKETTLPSVGGDSGKAAPAEAESSKVCVHPPLTLQTLLTSQYDAPLHLACVGPLFVNVQELLKGQIPLNVSPRL